MRRKRTRRTIVLAAAAMALTAGLSVKGTMAYFTTYATASGKVQMDMGFTEITPLDDVDRSGKHAGVKNTGDYDCFVRMKVISDIPVSYQPEKGWKDGGDGFWYYGDVLEPGEQTSELLITYELPKGEVGDVVNIIILPEYTSVVYSEDGTPEPDWDHVVTAEETE